MESTFELFSIGVGPSSSHTVGPMKAAYQFTEETAILLPKVTRIQIDLYGSLALTSIGHKTDFAVIVGMMSFSPESINIDLANEMFSQAVEKNELKLAQKYIIDFDYQTDVVFNKLEFLPEHANGMRFSLFQNKELLCAKEYFSIGGGFILDKEQILGGNKTMEAKASKPYEFATAKDLSQLCHKNGITIAELMYENEISTLSESDVIQQIEGLWQVMNDSINRGINAGDEILPGGLNVRRRAPTMLQKLNAQKVTKSDFNYLNAYAIAVNEQNACGQKVVTAPTNGAAGIIPAVLRYFLENNPSNDEKSRFEIVKEYLLTCSAIGMLYKSGASISAAEVGCQGEVGVACSMAAAGYCALLGGDVDSIESAAEIAMEHNLGLTCDPIKGLVQIPCIERNAMGAVQAINAAKLAHLDSGEKTTVGLDYVIKAMYETGLDMSSKYKETSLGGLAINVPVC